MSKSTDPVTCYIHARKKVLDHFHCHAEFHLRPLLEVNWEVQQKEDYYFLSYWLNDGERTNSVIVKKNGEPMIYPTDHYTLIIGIDCIKIGFLLKNTHKQKPVLHT